MDTDFATHVCGERGVFWHGCDNCLAVNLARTPRPAVARYLSRYAREHGREAAIRLGELIRSARERESEAANAG